MKRMVCIVVGCMLVLSTSVLVRGEILSKSNHYVNQSIIEGTTYYVGGSGPGNYSKIQDAINDSVDGDTVYVFDDSSPYFENLIINKTITLIGEAKETTIIDGSFVRYTVGFFADNIHLSGFTIQNGGRVEDHTNEVSVYVRSDYNTILDTIITKTSSDGETGMWIREAQHNQIVDNHITNNIYGIWLEDSHYNTISNNQIIDNRDAGIILGNSDNNKIMQNTLKGSEFSIGTGLYLRDSSLNEITGNEISNNEIGVWITEYDSDACDNVISQNNIRKNSDRNAHFDLGIGSRSTNIWDANFWGRSYIFSKLILGSRAVYLIPGMLFHFPEILISIPWFTRDRNPTDNAYEISDYKA